MEQNKIIANQCSNNISEMKNLEEEIEKVLRERPDETYYGRSELQSIIKLLSADNKFEIFHNHCHRLGAISGICFNGELEFPNQVIRRAKQVGVHQALDEISGYLDSAQIEIECALLLYNIQIDSDFTFSNGVRLTRVSSIRDPNLIKFLDKENISTGGSDTAILSKEYITPKEYSSSLADREGKTNWTKIEVKTKLINILNDTRFMLSLGRHPKYGVPVVGSFEVIPDHLQFLNNGVGYEIFSEPRTVFGPSIIEIELQKADQLLSKFNSLPLDDRARIRIVAKRLNDSKIDADWANKSINLRICLENLFCGKSEFGIAQTISERAPNYTSFSKTRARKVYAFLSTAVHTGTPPEHETITEDAIITEIHKTVIKFIEEGGYPDWPMRQAKGRLHRFIKCIKSVFSANKN